MIRTELGLAQVEQVEQFCADCDAEWPTMFMLTDAVWQTAGLPVRGIWCFKCVELRLGRRLRPDDFKEVPLNDVILAVLRERV